VRDDLFHIHDGCWMLDADSGEKFLNFLIHKQIRLYAGIDIQPFRTAFKRNELNILSRFTLFMGCGPSPYLSVHLSYLTDEFAGGNPKLDSNHMRYDLIRMKMPG
jgi:hypothetical protein